MSAAKAHFWLMAFTFKIRDIFRPRKNIIAEAGIKKGDSVLDFGCGPGGYILPVHNVIGASGKIYALDVNPAAVKMVRNLASAENICNLTVIQSDCSTGLPDESIDAVLLYDVYHHLENPLAVINELARVLKRGGLLSLSDHHMKDGDILKEFGKYKDLVLIKKGRKTYSFVKN